MQEFRNSKYESYYPDQAATFDDECRIRIDDDMVVVEYDNDDGVTTYRGHSVGQGHYVLKGVGFDASASLHRAPGSQVLEGSWAEEGYKGMWRITLR